MEFLEACQARGVAEADILLSLEDPEVPAEERRRLRATLRDALAALDGMSVNVDTTRA